MSYFLSQLRLVSRSKKFGSRASNSKLARLLDSGLESDPRTITPHLSDKSLARDDDTSKADLDILEGAKSNKQICVSKICSSI